MTLDDILRKNERLRNIHAGKRCFLVGNGPSINTQDLTVLKDEVTVVATSFFRHRDAKTVNPRYWVFADPHFWTEPEQYFIPAFKAALEKGCSAGLFVPSGGFSYFSGFNRGPLIDLHFYHYDPSREHVAPIDFTKGIPPYGQNVMTVCLMLALYLGCNPIYFIGVDHDYVTMTKEEYEHVVVQHFYADPTQNKCSDHLSWEQWERAMQRTFYEYEQLRDYASAHGIDVCNATPGGNFNTFPRVEYESLFAQQPSLLPPAAASTAAPLRLGEAAVRLMNSGDNESALVLLDEALRGNTNNKERVDGLEYLKAVCLARLRRFDQALILARRDYRRNPSNREKSERFVREIEKLC
ncbi:MAG: hypothetical protein HGA78_07120 [Nitrospirales bacterium]|nr:hypothetical protein [Nitrospirales bacterium]